MQIYFAGPLFTLAEREFNDSLAGALRGLGANVFLPQEAASSESDPHELLTPEMAQRIFRRNVRELSDSGVVVAITDGADVDSGTAWECGYAFGKRIPIVLVRTDTRPGGDGKGNVNLMLSAEAAAVVSVPELTSTGGIAARIVTAIEEATESSKE